MRNDFSPTDFLKIAAHTAEHFGFKTIDSLTKDQACKDCAVTLPHNLTDKAISSEQRLINKGLRAFCEDKLHAIEKPVLLYNLETDKESGETAISFHIFNVQKSIAEAILIQSNRSLLNELGLTDQIVRINSLGDTDSLTRYNRELTTFLRKRADLMPETARERMKEHVLLALDELLKENHELAYKSPNPMEYLSDQSRKHFRDIIEFLDMSDTPYEIDPKMIHNHDVYSDALFSIEFPNLAPEEKSVNVFGGRFDEMVYRQTKKRTPAAGSVTILKSKNAPNRLPKPKLETPGVFIIQLGFGPKIRSLMIIDELRRSGVNVFQDLANDSLSAQLRDAEALGVKHVVIIGQKEFVENTVILRDIHARKQEQIPREQLLRKLKRGAVVKA